RARPEVRLPLVGRPRLRRPAAAGSRRRPPPPDEPDRHAGGAARVEPPATTSTRRPRPSWRCAARAETPSPSPVLPPGSTGTLRAMEQHQAPDRNLAMDLARVTEAAALAAGRWVGRGDKEAADQAAVDAMRLVLNTVPMDGIVVIGEGEKDEAPLPFHSEELGAGRATGHLSRDP